MLQTHARATPLHATRTVAGYCSAGTADTSTNTADTSGPDAARSGQLYVRHAAPLPLLPALFMCVLMLASIGYPGTARQSGLLKR